MRVSSNKLLQKYAQPTSYDAVTLLSAQNLSDSNFPEAAYNGMRHAQTAPKDPLLGFYQVTQPLVPLTPLSENPLDFFGSFSARLHPAQVPQIFSHAGPNNGPIGHQTGRASGPMARSPAVHRPPQWPSTATRLSAPH